MDITNQVITSLRLQDLPVPTRTWVEKYVTSPPLRAPLPSLVATARIRLLATDLTTTDLLAGTYIALRSFTDESLEGVSRRQFRLRRDVLVQILDLEDISRSRWEQVEDLEAIERGEQTRGRQVIRLPVGGEEEDGEEAESVSQQQQPPPQQQHQQQQQRNQGPGQVALSAAPAKKATHRLVLQDAKGRRLYGLERSRIDRIAIGKTKIGEKLLLKSEAIVARGVVLLEPKTCVFLGGKVEELHKSWLEDRLARLRYYAQESGRAQVE